MSTWAASHGGDLLCPGAAVVGDRSLVVERIEGPKERCGGSDFRRIFADHVNMQDAIRGLDVRDSGMSRAPRRPFWVVVHLGEERRASFVMLCVSWLEGKEEAQ